MDVGDAFDSSAPERTVLGPGVGWGESWAGQGGAGS